MSARFRHYKHQRASAMPIVCALFCVVLSRDHIFGQDVDPIEELHKSLQRFEDVELRAQIVLGVSSTLRASIGAALPSEQVPAVFSLRFRRKLGHAVISQKEGSAGPGDTDSFQIDHVLFENGDVLHCQARLGPGLVQVEGVNDDLGFSLYSKRLAGVQDLDHESALRRVGDSATLYGIVGGTPLMKYLNHPARITMDREGAQPTVVSESPQGSLKLTLDPEYGYLPSGFTLIKRGSQIYNGRQVAEIDMHGDNRIWPPGKVESIEWEGKNTRLTFDDGKPFIGELTVVKCTKCASGVVVTYTTHATVTDLKFSPNSPDDAFNTDIKAPVGYDVTVVGASHLPYEWDGTKPVPRVVHGDTLLRRMSDKSGVSLALFFGNAALLLVVCWLVFQKYRRQLS